MLRTFQKTELLALINTMFELHHSGALSEYSQNIAAFESCQEAAIVIGTTLEKRAENPIDIVSLLEQYCNVVYELSQNREHMELLEEMDNLINQVKERIVALPVVYQIVFMPYKAAMWDSMDSIWQACKADNRCECLVVPIPYFEYEQVGKERRGTLCYDGELFAEEVCVTHYQDYDMKTERPDVVYIHNPFDSYNLVTSVHPDYYSEELKKYAGLVVYSPYYVTSGFVGDTYLSLPSNNNVDYILAQSKYAKEYYKGYPWYDKVLPFGSPKLDKVIQMSRNKPQMPDEWTEIIGNKKSLMLNTSIGCILNQGDVYLSKLQHIFEWFKGRDDVALIWRPHPLLESTLKSMRRDMLERYYEMVDYFKREKIGVYDTTSDISLTVAIADGYIGENSTSVINLFAAAGKPLFILNNLIYDDFPAEQAKLVGIMDMIKIKNKWYMNIGCNGIYSMERDWTRIRLEKKLEGAPMFVNLNGGMMEKIGDEIYFTPTLSSKFVSYNIVTGRYQVNGSQAVGKPLLFKGIAVYGKKVYYIPNKSGVIVEYDTVTRRMSMYTECIRELKGAEWNANYEEVTNWRVYDGMLWAVAGYTNRVLCLDLKTGKHKLYEVGDKGFAYTDVEIDGKNIWLSEAASGKLMKCDKRLNIVEIYHMPQEWKCWKNQVGRNLAFGKLIDVDKWIVAISSLANGVVKLNKQTGECKLLCFEIFEDIDKVQNGYNPFMYGVSGFAKRMDDKHFAIQFGAKGMIALIDVEQESYEEIYPTFDEETFDMIFKDNDGFEKLSETAEFSRKESAYYTLQGFVEDLVNNRLTAAMERQREEIRSMTDNFDGTAGEQVHEFIMSRLVGH